MQENHEISAKNKKKSAKVRKNLEKSLPHRRIRHAVTVHDWLFLPAVINGSNHGGPRTVPQLWDLPRGYYAVRMHATLNYGFII